MEKIVSKGICIDLHIHSVYSKNKDKGKVANNTLENLPILVKKLIENNVNLCSITDHDTFNYEIYESLKKEEGENNCIKKVLPGIEFSVEFEQGKVIHIVTIFDDRDMKKVKLIEEIMLRGIGKTYYDKEKQAYKKADYFEILSSIGIDFIMIAHQKKSVMTEGDPEKTDVMSLGKETFNQLVFMDYFDAFEFRNKKNEIYNKAYSLENNMEENLRFITGSDCHNWKHYPDSVDNQKSNFSFTYIKSLPTFKGVAMAITEHNRINLTNNFFSPVERYVNEISLNIGSDEVIIPMSKGVNVIIGDNSVGKSLFLHAITGNYKIKSNKILNGYKKYLEKNKIQINTYIPEECIFKFNMQGEIKELFDSEGMRPDDYLKQFYPNEINSSKYREIVENELNKLYGCLTSKFEFDNQVKNLKKFRIPKEEVLQKNLIFLGEVEKIDYSTFQNMTSSIEIAIKELSNAKNLNLLNGDECRFIDSTIDALKIIKGKYKAIIDVTKKKNLRINIYNTYLKKYKEEYLNKNTDEQVLDAVFVEAKRNVIQDIGGLIKKKKSLKKYKAHIEKVTVVPETNPVDKYYFVSKIGIEEINDEYIESLINNPLSKGRKINTLEITEPELKQWITRYPTGDIEVGPIDALKMKINSHLDKDFKVYNSIVERKEDLFEEASVGFDSQTYFTLLSGEKRDQGIYLIDQPEDHISQKAIKENVINEFRRMGRNRQVIMVTHNPQFIVNLDVDNVIFLSKDANGFSVKSGALEYENDEYSILKIVADNIEGGLPTILERMKRYEKNI